MKNKNKKIYQSGNFSQSKVLLSKQNRKKLRGGYEAACTLAGAYDLFNMMMDICENS